MNILLRCHSRLLLFALASLYLATALATAPKPVHAQGGDNPADSTATGEVRPAAVQTTLDGDGYTHWRLDLDPTCRFYDHSYTLNVPEEPGKLSDISLTATTFDVDYLDPQDCEGGSEVDPVAFNGNLLGILTGANESWSVNAWNLTNEQVVRGANRFFIDTDSTGTGCWCVGVSSVDLRAKVGFEITETSPAEGEIHRDFHAGKLDLKVTFSTDLNAATVNDATFTLAYRDLSGKLQEVPGAFTLTAPNQFGFQPFADLKDGVRYYVTVFGGANGVKSAGGATLAATRTWSFWTVPDLSLVDRFEYGDGKGSRCRPSSSPCPAVEIAVFQVARNAALVAGKDTVARIYVRWKRHGDVHPDDQVKDMNVNVVLRLGAAQIFAGATSVRRPNEYSDAQIAAAQHTINIYHRPTSGTTYTAEITPLGGAQPLTQVAVQPLASAGKTPAITFDHYYLKDGDWKSGVPADVKTGAAAFLLGGSQLTLDMFPALSVTPTEKGDFTIGYTPTGVMLTHPSCGSVREVMCPLGGASFKLSEPLCVYNKLLGMLGGKRFVSASIPTSVCPNVGGVAFGDKVLLLPPSSNPVVVPHEVGHIYGISTANSPNNKHRNDPTGIEGFQVRTKQNRSRTEMENEVPPESLMHTGPVANPAAQWPHNDDYATLLGTVSAQNLTAADAGPYLIVTGLVDVGANSVQLDAVFQQAEANGPPENAGICTAALVNGSNQTLASVPFTPNAETFPELRAVTSPSPRRTIAAVPAAEPASFSVSLPWQEAARALQIRCNGATILTRSRSATPPQVDFTNLASGATLSDEMEVAWTGSDANSDALIYQLQFSDDAGVSWTPLTAFGAATSHRLDTNLLPSGSNRRLRVLVSDGFDTAYAARTVTIANPLTVLSLAPEQYAEDVSLNTAVQIQFNTPLDIHTLTPQNVELSASGDAISATLHLSDDGRLLTLQPLAALAPDKYHSIEINDALKDTSGGGLEFGWFNSSFTTEADTVAPYVVDTYPADGARDVPLKALVQATISEDLRFGAINQSTLRLEEAGGPAVAGLATYTKDITAAVFLPNVALKPNTTYTATLSAAIADSAGNPMGSDRKWRFTTGQEEGPTTLILGNVAEETVDKDSDGLLDRLTLYVDVQSRGGSYNLNGRLLDRQGNLIQWAAADFGDGLFGGYLEAGVHRLALHFDADLIRAHNVDGPYFLDALFYYSRFLIPLPVPLPPEGDLRYRVYQTLPYPVTRFSGVLSFKPLPDRLVEWNTTRENAWNLRDYTIDLARPVSEVTYSIIGNTDPRVGVSIDASANIDIHPQPNVEAESDVTVKGCDTAGNCAQGVFTVRVQKPQAVLIAAPPAVRVAANGTRSIDVEIQDQWLRVYTGKTITLNFESEDGLGVLTPESVTTSTGKARVTYQAGPNTGEDTVSIFAAGGLSAEILIAITEGRELYLPMIHGE